VSKETERRSKKLKVGKGDVVERGEEDTKRVKRHD